MKRESGFTLVEMIVAMTILGTMLMLLYQGLAFALRSWDASDVNGRMTMDRRIGENFLRREVSELFPMRWKDPAVVKFAFEGDARHMRFVSARPAGISQGGLSLVSLEVQEDAKDRRLRNLVMLRAMPDEDQKDFRPLDKAEPSILIANVDEVAFSYFGSENDFAEPRWLDDWTFTSRVPAMVRVRVKASGGALPEMVMKVVLGEEAGCLENSFQRQCRPRQQ